MPITETKRVVAVLVCSACGKIFRYELPYIVDRNRKAPDGGSAVFHELCYVTPSHDGESWFEETLIHVAPPALKEKSGVTFAFDSSLDGVKVYKFEGEFSKELRHAKKDEARA